MADKQRIEIPAESQRLSEVRDFVGRFTSRLGLNARAIANVRLAVDEACTNVVKHAYPDEPGTLGVQMSARRGWLEIRIWDQGRSFDGRVEIPHLGRYVDKRRQGGLGVFLMHRLMDEVRYETTPGGNEWVLRKRLPRQSSGLGRSLRFRYGMRTAFALLGITIVACVPLWVNAGRQHDRAEEQALRALAFGLVEAARPVLLERAEFSPEQTRLFENVYTLMREESRFLAVHVVDQEGLIWAADRAAAAFTRFNEPSGLGEADARGVQQTVVSIEGEPILHLRAPVRVTDAQGGARDLGAVHLSLRWIESRQALQAARFRIVIVALGLYVVGALLLGTLLGNLLRPIQRLIDGVRTLGQGEQELEVDGHEEIGAIASAFNEVTAQCRAARASAATGERLQKEMEVAREIQSSILPQEVPEIPGYDIARLYRPAQEVGGDYYDFLEVADGIRGVVVADVAGKGVPGSLVMSMLRTALRMEARNNTNACDVLARMHAFMTTDMRKGMFATIFYVILDSSNRVISYASAGHTPMVLYRAATGETFFLNPRGIPLGLALPDTHLFQRSLDVERLRLRQGDMLVLYTDGVTEAMNTDGEQYGEDRLLQTIKSSGSGSAEEFVQALEQDLLDFVGDAEQSDDLTVVAIQEEEGAPVVQGGLRAKLVDLVDVQKMPVAEACRKLKVSPSTYYRSKVEAVDELEVQHLSLEKREKLRELVLAHPEMGPKQLAETLTEPQWGGFEAIPARLHAELRGMKLHTPALRIEAAQARAGGTQVATEIVPEGDLVHPGEMQDDDVLATGTAVGSGTSPGDQPALEYEPDPDLGENAFLNQGNFQGRIEICRDHPGLAWLQVEGSIDSASCEGLERLLDRASQSHVRIVVDLENVAYVSSRGWGLFASDPNDLRSRGGEIVLCGLRPELEDVYRMLGFDRVVQAFADRASVLRKDASVPASDLVPDEKENHKEAALPTGFLEGLEDLDEDWESLRVRSGEVGPASEVTILELQGILDTVSAYRFERILQEVVSKGTQRLVVDLSGTEFVSSAGWGSLTAHVTTLFERGGGLRLFGMNPEVTRIYELLNLEDVLPSFDLLADALRGFGIEQALPIVEATEPLDRDEVERDFESDDEHHENDLASDPEIGDSRGLDLDANVVRVEDDFGDLHASLLTHANLETTQRLVLQGVLQKENAGALEAWLGEHAATVPLLLVDTSALEATDPEALAVLVRHARVVEDLGFCVYMITPSAHSLHLGLPIFSEVEAALRAYEERNTATLHDVRLPDVEFHKDHAVRREGWQAYVSLLRTGTKGRAA